MTFKDGAVRVRISSWLLQEYLAGRRDAERFRSAAFGNTGGFGNVRKARRMVLASLHTGPHLGRTPAQALQPRGERCGKSHLAGEHAVELRG